MHALESIRESVARRYNVCPEIHPQDFLFQYIRGSVRLDTDEKATEEYFEDGANSARKLGSILSDVCGYGDRQVQLLEFASGYGMVTRHIRNVMPRCSTTSCDIHPQAVQFIREKLATEAVLSASKPEDIFLDKTFDVVFALSFFSHMPKDTFSRWLEQLASFVKPEGYLIFTTHGLRSLRSFRMNFKFDEEGFYFRSTSEQMDLSAKEYGSTFVTPQYVIGRLAQMTNLPLQYFREGYWWGHQDVYVAKAVDKYTPPGRIARITKTISNDIKQRSWRRLMKKVIRGLREL